MTAPDGEPAFGGAAAVVAAGSIRNCSVQRTLDILDDAWSFLVLREFYMGARRFEEIRTVLGAPRTTISLRLSRLVEFGIICKVDSTEGDGPAHYRLTESGRDLFLVMLTLMRFGDRHLADERGPPLTLVHSTCGQPFEPLTVCSACHGEVDNRSATYRDGPGAGRELSGDHSQRRRRKRAGAFERNRPSSVSRALEIFAEKSTFLVLREFFFGGHRFEEIRQNLGIAPNILSDRLYHLLDKGIIDRVCYSQRPLRYEYRLTEMGRDIYQSFIQMLAWGDQWLGLPAPLILTHRGCGKDFLPVVVCSYCRERVNSRTVQYCLHYPRLNIGRTPLAMLGDSARLILPTESNND